MQCYSQLTAPTAVSHSIVLPLLSATSNELVVAKTNLLQVFSITTVNRQVDSTTDGTQDVDRRISDNDALDESFLAADMVFQKAVNSQQTKLVLLTEFPLAGTLSGLARVRAKDTKSGGDRLLVSVKATKLSLLEWDPSKNTFFTISIHFYESDSVQAAPWSPDLASCETFLTADPGSRCAAFKFGVKSLAILPFRYAADEDMVLDDYDAELDEDKPAVNGNSENKTQEQTPYSPSFVLSLTVLDPAFTNPIHLAFLHEYREPTFGILFSSVAPTISLLPERKDVVSYAVITLDLQQRASTTILSLPKLPYDLVKVMPLRLPIGGALLVGSNELIHVDQAGRTNGVAVNEFAKQATSYGLADQSNLQLKLENCAIEQLSDSKELLLVSSSGQLAIISFKMDGRSISGIQLELVPGNLGGGLLNGDPSCTTPLNKSSMFIGSEENDSIVLGWTNPGQPKQKRAEEEDEEFSDNDLDDDDDLYGETTTNEADNKSDKTSVYKFSIHDRLINLAPMHCAAIGKPSHLEQEDANSQGVTTDLELVAGFGQGKAGGIAIMKKAIEPKVIGRFQFKEARAVWTIKAKKPLSKELAGSEKVDVIGSFDESIEYDKFMIVSQVSSTGDEDKSSLYELTSTGFQELAGTEFDGSAGGTVEVGTLGQYSRIVQILKSEVRSYDGDFNLIQIQPMFDDESDQEPQVLQASFADPYVLLIRDDGSVMILTCDKNGDIEEIDKTAALSGGGWRTGSLYADTRQQLSKDGVLMFLVNNDGALQIFSMDNLEQPVASANGLSFLPPLLTTDFTPRRGSPHEEISDILVTDLGDDISKSTYLILQTTDSDSIVYRPFLPQDGTLDQIRFVKCNLGTILPTKEESNQGHMSLRSIANVGGLSIVFTPGENSNFILKSSKSIAKSLKLRGKKVIGLAGFHTGGCEHGFVYLDSAGVVRVCQLPEGVNFTETGWTVKRVLLNEEVSAITYHGASEVYAVTTIGEASFELPQDDEYHKNWAAESISLRPRVEQSSVKLLSPKTWTFIDSYDLEESEMGVVAETLNLEISESTHERAQLITVGTAINKGIDLASRGGVYVFSIISVVPQPGRPETSHKLKLIAKEDVKGAITAICGVNGFYLAAQGQKVMVRGLKEDNSLLPVAFMDMEAYVSVAKSFQESGMLLLGDAGVGGLEFAGFSEEPYKMTLFGKDITFPIVAEAEFLPSAENGDINLLIADFEGNLGVVGFEPEHPKSLQGHILLPRSTFHIGAEATVMKILPSTRPDSKYQVLILTRTGSIGLVTSLPETLYRRLTSLYSYIMSSSSSYEPIAGLNPRAYRQQSVFQHASVAAAASITSSSMGHGMTTLDGEILGIWSGLNAGRKADVRSRIGEEDGESVREDLRYARGEGGLAYFE